MKTIEKFYLYVVQANGGNTFEEAQAAASLAINILPENPDAYIVYVPLYID